MTGFKNPKTGDIKMVKLGFSWTLFLFSSLFGIPLILRGLYLGGIGMLGLASINILLLQSSAAIIFTLMIWGFSFHYGFNGNKLTAMNYLKNGYEFLEPDTEFTKLAKRRWNIRDVRPVSPVSNEGQSLVKVEKEETSDKIIEKHYIYIDNENSGINQLGKLCVQLLYAWGVVMLVFYVLPVVYEGARIYYIMNYGDSN